MKHRTLVICPPHLENHVFPPGILEEIRQLTDCPWPVLDPAGWRQSLPALQEADFIFSTWGMPVLSAEFLASAPKLKAVFYSAGSIKCFATDAGWDRGIVISSAAAANSVPVAEYSMATILLSLKRFWHFSRYGRPGDGQPKVHVPGAYRTKVGLISLGAVGRATAKLLKPFDLTLLAYDPFVSPKLASELQIALVSLEEVFLECDVVSLHAPWLPETERMITGQLVASMKEGATLINTSRGALVAEDELAEVLARRPDLTAVLDVTYPEPAAKNSPLRSLTNVVLTPHIAGSMQQECSRMSRGMADELRRYLAGGPLCHAVTREQLALMA